MLCFIQVSAATATEEIADTQLAVGIVTIDQIEDSKLIMCV